MTVISALQIVIDLAERTRLTNNEDEPEFDQVVDRNQRAIKQTKGLLKSLGTFRKPKKKKTVKK